MDRYSEQGAETSLPGSLSETFKTTARPLHHPGLNEADSKHINAGLSTASGSLPTLNTTSSLLDAVNDAVESSSRKTTIDPNLINLITEQVVKQLQSQYSPGSTPFGPFPIPYVLQTPQSPGFSSVTSFPPHFTPSSSRRESDHSDLNDQPLSPGHVTSSTSLDRNKQSSFGCEDVNVSRVSSTGSRALPSQSESTPRSLERGSGQRRKESISEARVTDNLKCWIPGEENTNSSEPASFQRGRSRSHETSGETTALEKAWQPLFEGGCATVRLSQFLRGLANYIIDSYEPKRSLVITPAKMLRFFEETKVPGELYPWSNIFGAMKHSSLSVMYRKLLCHHHFVQAQPYDQPNVPGLTPAGFEALMTCLIQGQPDIEFQRLALAVKNMPISNADDARERFPKELSRRLFPAHGQVQAEQRLISSLNHEISLINPDHAAATMPPPPARPPNQHSSSMPAPDSMPTHSPRSSQGSVVTDNPNSSPPAVQFERQRKPYSAKERSGKIYRVDGDEREEQDVHRAQEVVKPHGDQNWHGLLSRPPQNVPTLSRSASYKAHSRHYSFNASTTENQRKLTQPPGTYPPPLVSNGTSGSSRRSSTPPRYNYSRSDQVAVGNNAPNNGARQYPESRPLERARTANDDERGRTKPSRNATQGSL